MKASERSMMIEHIMDANTPNNLGIALDTADVIYDIQKQILVAGAKGIIERLTKPNPTNQLHCIDDSLVKHPMDIHQGLRFRKDHWSADLSVGFEVQARNAGRVILGLANEKRPIDDRLRGMLTEFHGGGTGTEHWPWFYWVTAPYDRWTSKEALLGFRSGDAVTELTSQLSDVVDIVDAYFAG